MTFIEMLHNIFEMKTAVLQIRFKKVHLSFKLSDKLNFKFKTESN